jgi:hypothetical protein
MGWGCSVGGDVYAAALASTGCAIGLQHGRRLGGQSGQMRNGDSRVMEQLSWG